MWRARDDVLVKVAYVHTFQFFYFCSRKSFAYTFTTPNSNFAFPARLFLPVRGACLFCYVRTLWGHTKRRPTYVHILVNRVLHKHWLSAPGDSLDCAHVTRRGESLRALSQCQYKIRPSRTSHKLWWETISRCTESRTQCMIKVSGRSHTERNR